jgi:hypothetical protein
MILGWNISTILEEGFLLLGKQTILKTSEAGHHLNSVDNMVGFFIKFKAGFAKKPTNLSTP